MFEASALAVAVPVDVPRRVVEALGPDQCERVRLAQAPLDLQDDLVGRIRLGQLDREMQGGVLPERGIPTMKIGTFDGLPVTSARWMNSLVKTRLMSSKNEKTSASL